MPGFDPEDTAPAAAAAVEGESAARRPGPAPAAKPPTPEPPVLPDVTTDERDIGWGDPPDPGDDDRYLREVPPHHGS